MNIYVGNISFDTTEEQLRDLFTQFGEIKSSSVVKDKFTGRSRGFGFVEMAERADGEKAIEQLHNSSFGNRSIVVNEARPKTEGGGGGRSSSFSRGGGRDRY